MAMNIERLIKGDHYYFILGIEKVTLTRDEYFWSDNLRWEEGNYFITKDAASACFIRLAEKFKEDYTDIESKIQMNESKLIAATWNFYNRYNPANESDVAKLLKEFIAKVDECRKRKEFLYEKRCKIREDIKEFIKNAPKR